MELERGKPLAIVGPQGSGKTVKAVEIATEYGSFEVMTATEYIRNSLRPDMPDVVIMDEDLTPVTKAEHATFQVKLRDPNGPFVIITMNDLPIGMEESGHFNILKL